MKLTGVALATLLLLGPALAQETPAFAPTSSAALPLASGKVAVTWTPGAEVADSYRVYGLDGDARTLLAEHPAAPDVAGLAVEAGHARYGVTGVRDGEESPLTLAVAPGLWSRPCITIRLLPPPPGINITCFGAAATGRADPDLGRLLA